MAGISGNRGELRITLAGEKCRQITSVTDSIQSKRLSADYTILSESFRNWYPSLKQSPPLLCGSSAGIPSLTEFRTAHFSSTHKRSYVSLLPDPVWTLASSCKQSRHKLQEPAAFVFVLSLHTDISMKTAPNKSHFKQKKRGFFFLSFLVSSLLDDASYHTLNIKMTRGFWRNICHLILKIGWILVW